MSKKRRSEEPVEREPELSEEMREKIAFAKAEAEAKEKAKKEKES